MSYKLNTTGLSKVEVDTVRKAAIVDCVQRAADGGVHLTPTAGAVTGPLTVSQLQIAISVPYQEASRLVHELVGDGSIVMVGGGDAATQSFTVAG